jgi:hypothetical protein
MDLLYINGAQISMLKGFRILFRICEVIQNSRGFPAVASAWIKMSNFQWLMTTLKGQHLENHSWYEELVLISIHQYF